MGCQVGCGDFELPFSDGAWLIVALTRKWFNEERDTDGEGYQWSIGKNAFQGADRATPWAFDYFKGWATENNINYSPNLNRQQFNQSRQFLHDAVLSGDSGWLSY